MTTGMQLRDYRIHRYVNAFCPHCHEEEPDRPLDQVERLSGWLAIRNGRVWLERGCRTHGLVRTLYDESAEILQYLEQWTAPTKAHTPDVAGNFAPVPAAYADGLPEMQTQHTCILLEDITDHCNLRCPTCFSDSAPALTAVAPLASVLASIDNRLARENGRIDVLMLSGGEPTLYPQLEQLIAEVVARPIVRILLNSNGLRIASGRCPAGAAGAASRACRGLPAVRRRERSGVDAPSRRRHPTLQGTGDRAALGSRCLHHPDDDRGARCQRRRARVRHQAGARHAVRRRRHDPARVRLRALCGGRPDGPAHPHRGARTAGGADSRCGDVEGPDGAAVLAPALLLGGIPAAGRLRELALADVVDRS
ncbi:MAG: radical SAM protein [Nocardioidaceae bacterium]